jgi:hypothetical protein
MEIFYKKNIKLSEFLGGILIIGALVLMASIFYISILNEAKNLKGNESLSDNNYLFC